MTAAVESIRVPSFHKINQLQTLQCILGISSSRPSLPSKSNKIAAYFFATGAALEKWLVVMSLLFLAFSFRLE